MIPIRKDSRKENYVRKESSVRKSIGEKLPLYGLPDAIMQEFQSRGYLVNHYAKEREGKSYDIIDVYVKTDIPFVKKQSPFKMKIAEIKVPSDSNLESRVETKMTIKLGCEHRLKEIKEVIRDAEFRTQLGI